MARFGGPIAGPWHWLASGVLATLRQRSEFARRFAPSRSQSQGAPGTCSRQTWPTGGAASVSSRLTVPQETSPCCLSKQQNPASETWRSTRAGEGRLSTDLCTHPVETDGNAEWLGGAPGGAPHGYRLHRLHRSNRCLGERSANMRAVCGQLRSRRLRALRAAKAAVNESAHQVELACQRSRHEIAMISLINRAGLSYLMALQGVSARRIESTSKSVVLMCSR